MAAKRSYTLKHPVQIGSETITELHIGAVKGKHMRSLPADPKSYTVGTMMELAQKITGQPSVVFDEMDQEDLQEVLEIVGEQFGTGPGTGGTG